MSDVFSKDFTDEELFNEGTEPRTYTEQELLEALDSFVNDRENTFRVRATALQAAESLSRGKAGITAAELLKEARELEKYLNGE